MLQSESSSLCILSSINYPHVFVFIYTILRSAFFYQVDLILETAGTLKHTNKNTHTYIPSGKVRGKETNKQKKKMHESEINIQEVVKNMLPTLFEPNHRYAECLCVYV